MPARFREPVYHDNIHVRQFIEERVDEGHAHSSAADD